jgi:hypothetical protein
MEGCGVEPDKCSRSKRASLDLIAASCTFLSSVGCQLVVLWPSPWRQRCKEFLLAAVDRLGLVKSQAELSAYTVSRQPSSASKPGMSWARAARPSVIDQKPSSRRAFIARLRSVARI